LFNPCVFIAAPYHIEYLHKFGYQTFPELIDESYDRIENNEKRIKFVTKQLELIINKSFSELHSIYVDILPKIKHNQLKIMQTNREEILLKSFDGIVNKNE
jgi:effector-binding domain-containing protein